MSYCINLVRAKFFVAEKDKYPAYKALRKELGSKPFWNEIHCLEDVLYTYCYSPKNDSGDNICGIDYNGEKLGIEEEMFRLLAPYVKSGSYIEMVGEDGGLWRWVFENGAFKEVKAKTVWND